MKKSIMFLFIVVLAVSFTYGGIEWTAKITTTGKNKTQNNDITARLYAQNGNVKQVFEGVSKDNILYPQGGYWLYKANENNIYIVNDKDKTYMVLSIDSMLQMAGAMGQLVKMEVQDPSVTVDPVSEDTIIGYPCSHVKINSEYTLKMKVVFIKQTVYIQQQQEIWASTHVPGLKEMHDAFMNKNFKTGFEGLDELIQQQMKQQQKLGFPLKTITRTISKSKKDKEGDESISTYEVTKIETKNFPESFFDIPSSYAETGFPGAEGNSKGGKKKFGIF